MGWSGQWKRRYCVATVALCAGLAGLGAFPPYASAGLLKPQPIDAGTGGDAVAVGSSLGLRQGWVGLMQQTAATGAEGVYAAYARNGVFGHPFAVDRGNAVVTAGLAGNDVGAAVIVWTEQVGAVQVLFGRRLSNGNAGPIEQISTAGQDAHFGVGTATSPFDRSRGIAMNDGGAAVLCYTDAAAMKTYAATLAPAANAWATVPVAACGDPHLDARGDALLGVGPDNNNKFAAFELIGGQFRSEVIDPNVTPMDEFSVALGSGGAALALGRDNNFHAIAYSKSDLASSGVWTNVGPLEQNLIQANANPEDPFGALDAHGNGIVVFRDNSMANPQGYFRIVTDGVPGSGGVLDKSSSRQRAAVDASGSAFVAYSAADFKSGFINLFQGASPGTPLPLAPGLEPYHVPSLTSLAVDPAGNFLVLISQGSMPTHVYAVFGDFVRPTLRPRVSPRRPRHSRRVVLHSGATDDFAALVARDIRWKLPHGVRLKRKSGGTIHVTFRRRGTYHIRVMATDLVGNRTTRTFTVHVR